MRLIQANHQALDLLAPLAADFRAALRGYKGVASGPDLPAAREELREFLAAGYPIFAVTDGSRWVGYAVFRIEDSLLWLEQIYVRPEYRRQGVASLLFDKAEDWVRSLGEETVFNYVHPNNDGMIRFLRSRGYTVLNLIEIRRPYAGEQLNATIHVENNAFDY